MSNDLEFKLINSFKCKRCGSTNDDKLIYTGANTLDDDDSIILEDYIKDDTLMKNINSSPYELMNTSKFTDEGVENINEKYKKEK